MSAPESVRVGPHLLTIEYSTAKVDAENVRSGRGILGYTEIGGGHIFVCGPDCLSPSMTREVVIHECLHVIMDMAGLAYGMGEGQTVYTEEGLLQALDTALLALIRDNPDLVGWLADAPPPSDARPSGTHQEEK